MNVSQALAIIKPLSDGIDPFTGEEFPSDSPYQHPQIVRALYLSISLLEKEEIRIRKHSRLPPNAGKPWTEEEDNKLAREFKLGRSIRELSEIHQRTTGAIQSRLIKQGLIDQME